MFVVALKNDCVVDVVTRFDSISDFRDWIRSCGGDPDKDYDAIYSVPITNMHERAIEAMFSAFDANGNAKQLVEFFDKFVRVGMEFQKKLDEATRSS